ncbi:hypothetical protein [Comamonas serinivorans]|uniref:hypothetical protein n=1 Tax=Comamonas serinivorans TaxID=1082851 RepID=UPI0012FB6541|nr:hypothetical protein [Comamonas serinivorans]
MFKREVTHTPIKPTRHRFNPLLTAQPPGNASPDADRRSPRPAWLTASGLIRPTATATATATAIGFGFGFGFGFAPLRLRLHRIGNVNGSDAKVSQASQSVAPGPDRRTARRTLPCG